MEDVRDLKALQLDALREVANIGAGHAATALSQLTHRRIMISVPEINIARLEEVPGLIGDPQEVVAAVLMHMLGDLTGRTLLMFPEPVGRQLCDMLLKRPLGTTQVFETIEQSCIKEAGNILSGAYMNALSEFMGMLLLPSVPSLVVDLSAAVLTTTYPNFGHDRGFVFCVEAEFNIDAQERLRSPSDVRDARWELGRTYALMGANEEEVAEFEELLARKPKDVAGIIQLGLGEKSRGRLEVATEWFLRAVEEEPDSSVDHFYLGEVYYNRGLNEPALTALERAVSLNPDNANAHYLMAFVLGDMGRHQDARAASKRAIQLNPPLARAQTNLSLERYRAERQSAEHRLREHPAPEVVEGSELAHYNLGLAFRQKGYYAEALREYRLAIERGEDRRLVRQAMAEGHLVKRDFADALELYESLIHEVPDSPKLWNERGVVLHQAGRTVDALASYRQATEVDPRYALAWNNVGVALAHQSDAEDAIDGFRKALQLSSQFVGARLNLALLLTHLRRFQLALEAYRQVLAGQPTSAPAWNGVGLVLVELKRFPDARNAFVR